ncbi:MAG: hypothetical protein ABR968_04570 [Bacteroidales bacterium]|jgi:hypothetical protein
MKNLEIFFVLVAAIGTIIITFKWKKLNWIKRGFIIVAIIAAIIVAWNQFQENRERELIKKIEATFGDISDLDGATIPKIQIGDGDSTAKFIIPDGVWRFHSSEPIKVYVKNNKLFVSTIIRDRKGDIVAALYENEWEMVKKEYDYNNDETAFEVVTKGDRKVYFHIELKNGIACIVGLLLNENGRGVYICNNMTHGVIGSLIVTVAQDSGNYHFRLPDNIKPIFKYPRAKYFGVRELKK